jgi:uncharacterized protein YceH (UPF0502 family)
MTTKRLIESTMESDRMADQAAPKWRPLSTIQRRVLGVLVEKAKTTPNAYPLTLNAVTTGCNQKSNRDPQLALEPEDVEDALTQLREAGAVGELQDGGRVAKYRHYCKAWLGVDGSELAVMAELLLRGPQTLGDLRARAARMAHGQLPDLAALRPVLRALQEQGLVLALTPEGRGHVVSHALFEPEELSQLKARFAGGTAAPPGRPATGPAASAAPRSSEGDAVMREDALLESIQEELRQLRSDVVRLKQEVEDIWNNLRH